MKTPNEVHAFLAARYGGRGYVLKLARKLGKSKANISQTINGLAVNRDTRESIAADSNMSCDEFFEPEFDLNTGLKERAA